MFSLLMRKQKHRAPSFGWAPETTEKLKIALLENDVVVGMCWDEELLGQADREKFVFGGRVTLNLTAAQQNFLLWGDEEVLHERQVTIWVHPFPSKVCPPREEWEEDIMMAEEVSMSPSTVSPSDGSRAWSGDEDEAPVDSISAKPKPPTVTRYQSFDSSIATSTIHTDLSFSVSITSSATSQASDTPLPSPARKLKISIPILTESPAPSPTSISSSSYDGAYFHPDEAELEGRISWKRAREDAVPATPFTGFPYPAIDDAPYVPAEPSLGQRQNWGGLTASHGAEYIGRITKEAYQRFERRVGYGLMKGGLDHWDGEYRDWLAFNELPAPWSSEASGKTKMIFSDMPLYEEPESM